MSDILNEPEILKQSLLVKVETLNCNNTSLIYY